MGWSHEGAGSEQDMDRAIRLYRQAAQAGTLSASIGWERSICAGPGEAGSARRFAGWSWQPGTVMCPPC
jgi:TPR repeat protein